MDEKRTKTRLEVELEGMTRRHIQIVGLMKFQLFVIVLFSCLLVITAFTGKNVLTEVFAVILCVIVIITALIVYAKQMTAWPEGWKGHVSVLVIQTVLWVHLIYDTIRA